MMASHAHDRSTHRFLAGRNTLAVLLLATLSSIGGCGDDEQVTDGAATTHRPAGGNAGQTVTLALRPQNGSHVSGTATLRERGGQSKVTLALTSRRRHHAHIHDVSCRKYRAMKGFDARVATVAETLNDTTIGTSTTLTAAPLSDYRTAGTSINIHMDEVPYRVVACGDVPAE